MSRLRFYIFFLLGVIISYASFSQNSPKPAECTTPPTGWKLGSSFNVSPNMICINYSKTIDLEHSGGPSLTGVGFIFDFKAASQLTSPEPADAGGKLKKDISAFGFGVYWIAQTGTAANGDKYLTCNAVTVVPEKDPKITVERCIDNTVKIRIPVDANNFYNKYFIDWNDGSPIETITGTPPLTSPSHKYFTFPTNGKLSVRGSYAVGAAQCQSKTYEYPIAPAAGPYISQVQSTNNNTSAKITFKDFEQDKDYKVEYRRDGQTNWTAWGSTFKNGTAQIDNLDAKFSYCFRINATDPCGNTVTSPEACSILIKNSIIAKNTVKLDWNSPIASGVSRFDITRETIGGSSPTITFYPTPSGNTTHTDTEANGLKCGFKYNYNITTTYGSSPRTVRIISDITLADLTQSATLPRPNIVGTASVINNNTKVQVNILDFDLQAKDKYVFYRAEDNGDFKEISRENQPVYTDINVKPTEHRYCYKIQYGDDCNNVSEFSVPFCSVLLKSDEPGSLNWTPYSEDASIKQYITYDIVEVDDKGNPLKTVAFRVSDTKKVLDENVLDGNEQKRIFVIWANYAPPGLLAGSLYSYSNTSSFVLPAKFYIPTAFTPNSDGQSDMFEVKSRFIEDYKVVIYDRWGKPFYEAENQGWSGFDSDEVTPVPPGYYTFKIIGTDQVGQKVSRTGSVMLIR
ncbi:MAG: gliding motility-associated C-terminal domain-containing protein [Spirosomataceae bacterium]